jgi:hypothetical protein
MFPSMIPFVFVDFLTVNNKKPVTTLIFLHSFSQYIGNIQVIFFFDIQVPPKFRQSLSYTGRSQVIDIYLVYTSNISHLITQNHNPIILGLNPTHSHQHNTSYSITSYNVVQIKDSISTITCMVKKVLKVSTIRLKTYIQNYGLILHLKF